MSAIGHNQPPLDSADDLPKRLDEEFEGLSDNVMSLDMERLMLPGELASDEDCAKVSTWIANVKKLAGEAERKRKPKVEPYLAGQKAINSWFKALTGDLESHVETLTKKVGVYNRVKAERERAEREARAREERERAEAQRREEEKRRQEAEAAQREAEAAAAAIRQAADAEAREAAAAQMRAAEAQAEILREQAEAAAAAAAKSERKADSNERAAQGDLGRLSRIASDGATSSVTKKWAHEVTDWEALRASLGPLGPHLDNGILETTLARIVRQQSAGGATPTFQCPGVSIVEEHRTNIRAARG